MISGVIASYPLAYAVTDKEAYCGFDDLGSYTTNNIDEIVKIRIHFEIAHIAGNKKYKPFDWPVNIGHNKQVSAFFAIGSTVFQEDSRVALKG